MGWRNYFFGISGRVSRSRYWLLFAILAGLLLVSAAAIAAFDLAVYGRLIVPTNIDLRVSLADFDLRFGALCLFFSPFYGAVLFGAVTIPVKRLHDRNRSGWWLIFYALAPLILFSLAKDGMDRSSEDSTSNLILELVALGIFIASIVDLGILRGTPGNNYYGDDPLGNSPN